MVSLRVSKSSSSDQKKSKSFLGTQSTSSPVQSSPLPIPSREEMNKLLSKLDSESLLFLSHLEQSAWGFQEKFKTSSHHPWSDGMLDVFESFSFVCGPHPRPQSTISTIEHLTQWLEKMMTDVAVKRNQYRLRLLRQGHAPLRTLRDENTHTSFSTTSTSNSTSPPPLPPTQEKDQIFGSARSEERSTSVVWWRMQHATFLLKACATCLEVEA